MLACGDHAEMSAGLSRDYGESRVGLGLLSDGRMIELLASPTGTWSLLVTTVGRFSCLVAYGEGWQNTPLANKESVI